MRVTAFQPTLVVESGPKPSRSIQTNGPTRSTRKRIAIPDATKMMLWMARRKGGALEDRDSTGESYGFIDIQYRFHYSGKVSTSPP
jgi:hypothetical protein